MNNNMNRVCILKNNQPKIKIFNSKIKRYFILTHEKIKQTAMSV